MDVPRRRYVFSGRVQGVGFRQTTRRIAQAHPVAGYVRNLPDGRVEVVASGDADALAAFVGAIRREFAGDIENIASEPVPESVSLPQGFEIRY
jgi:acylphosphatase